MISFLSPPTESASAPASALFASRGIVFRLLERGAASMHSLSGPFYARAMTTSEMATVTRSRDEVRI